MMTYRGRIRLEDVATVQAHLDHSEILSLIFLVIDDALETAEQKLMLEMHSTRRFLPVLDSVSFGPKECYEPGILVDWAKYCDKHGSIWEDKLLEALYLIKNFQCLKMLGIDKTEWERMPMTFVNVVRKELFLMIEDFRAEDFKEQVQKTLISKASEKSVIVPLVEGNVPQYLLLLLMSRKILKTKTATELMDFGILIDCLEKAGQKLWAQRIRKMQNDINIADQPDPKDAMPRFLLDSHNQGTTIIFNEEDYNGVSRDGIPLQKRDGSSIDAERLQITFNLLNFEVQTFKNSGAARMRSKIRECVKKFCEDTNKSGKERCFTVAVLAHGGKDGVITIDGEMLSWEDLRQELWSSEFFELPRLLLIQACRGRSEVAKSRQGWEVVTDGPGNVRELFELSSCVPGFAAYRCPSAGSFFIYSFCKNVLMCGRNTDINQIAKLVNFDMKKFETRHNGKQVDMISMQNGTLSKDLYLCLPEERINEAKDKVLLWGEEFNKMPTTPLKMKKQEEELFSCKTHDKPAKNCASCCHSPEKKAKSHIEKEDKIYEALKASLLKKK